MFFSWANVEGHAADSGYPFDGESYEQTPGHELESDITPEYDAALSMLGDGWYIPGTQDFRELTDNCDYAMEEVTGVMCCVFTSRANGRKLVIPACGYFRDSLRAKDGELACLWTSRYVSSSAAYYFRVSESEPAGTNGQARRDGLPIRAVRDP